MRRVVLWKALSLATFFSLWTLAFPEGSAAAQGTDCIREDCQPKREHCKEIFRAQFRKERERCQWLDSERDRTRCRIDERRRRQSHISLCVGAFLDCKTCCRTGESTVCLWADQKWCYIDCLQELPGCFETMSRHYKRRKRDLKRAYSMRRANCRDQKTVAYAECWGFFKDCTLHTDESKSCRRESKAQYRDCKSHAKDELRSCYRENRARYKRDIAAVRNEYQLACETEFLQCETCCISDDPRMCVFAVCGDGAQEGDEQCDDRNLVDGDGCSASCQME